MPLLKVFLNIEIDGEQIRGFPIIRQARYDETQELEVEKAADADDETFSALPFQEITTVQGLLIRAIEQAIGIRVEGGETGNVAIRLAEGGLLLMVDVTLTGSNLTINNNSGETAVVRGLAFGT